MRVVAVETASWVAVVGTLGGLLIGLLAPFVSQQAQRRAARGDRQAEIARTALSLFEGGESLQALLGGPISSTRRQLFLLAHQMRDEAARKSCVALVASAGARAVDERELDDRWSECVQSLGRIARSG
jgi:hypothetical protein